MSVRVKFCEAIAESKFCIENEELNLNLKTDVSSSEILRSDSGV